MLESLKTEEEIQLKSILFILLEIIWNVFFSMFLYVILENIKYGDMLYTIEHIFYIFENAATYVVTPIIIIFSILLLLRSICKNIFVSNTIGVVILSLISIVSYYKFNALNLPFIPYDIALIKNIGQIASFGINKIPVGIIIAVLIFIVLFIMEYIFVKNKMPKKNKKMEIVYRIILFILSILLIIKLCINPNRYIDLKVKNDDGDNYAWMGAVGVFFMHLGDLYVETPDNYNEENIEEIKNNYVEAEQEETNIKPNVIFIMSESFADLTSLNNVTFSKNPLEGIFELENSKQGEILTPVFGGGTSLPEFEALTGLSSYFLSRQIFPYTSYIKSDMNSIVRVFKDNGYYTTGIHTNTETFYNRKNIYKYLGFDKTIFEEQIENPEYKGNYISDNELANQIINEFNSTEESKFIFAVTMQNHMPYKKKNYGSYDIQVNSGILKNEQLNEFRAYIQGVYDSTQMYVKIANYLKQQSEPTILVMFGDHWPNLGLLNLENVTSNLSETSRYRTPYVIWANYDINYSEEIPVLMSPSYLAINTLNLANISLPWYLLPFEELYKEYPAINNLFVFDRNQNKVTEILNDKLIEKCRILQHDLLIKKKYIEIK